MKINTGTVTAVFLANLASTYTVYRCMLKDPNARSLGEYSERREETLKRIWMELQDMVTAASGGIAFTPAVETLG